MANAEALIPRRGRMICPDGSENDLLVAVKQRISGISELWGASTQPLCVITQKAHLYRKVPKKCILGGVKRDYEEWIKTRVWQ
jgi:hypothetical protein